MATARATDDAPLSIEQLLALHPFPDDYAKLKRIERLWVFDLPGTPAALWPFISDTSRMNRALGTAEMTFVEKAGKRYGSSKAGGVKHEWLEVPWCWVAEQWLTSTRLYERGFMKVMYAIHRLEPTKTGTRVYLYFGAVPRNALCAAAIRIGFPSLEKAYRRVLPALAAQLDRLRPEILMLPPPPLPDEAEARLRTLRDQLVAEELPAACVDALVDFIRTGDDADLHRIQIRERARVWKLPELDLLRTALYATRAGLLDLSWDTICPHCRGLRDEHGKLAELAADGHCEVCQVDFTTDTPEAVEVTFRVHPAIRDVPERLYCSAEPSTKEHIRVSTAVPPGAKATVVPSLAPGRYTVWAGHRGGWYLDVDADGPTELSYQDHPEGHVVKAGPMPTVHFTNDGTEPEQFSIERATWSDEALRPGMLLSFQEFRDLFSEDYIGADVKLAVGEQTLLFTDVVGSTAFYASRGDPAAFVEIKKHFDEVFEIVRANRGAVVKTIGDAVMATFVSPLDAVRASRHIHDAFHPKRADTPIRLRISLNTGPCIAVRLNANADFFGGTVNVAAKLQALAEGYQIAMSETTYRAAGVAEYLASEKAELETLEYTSKALPAPVCVKRWSVYREP
jgi:class 3 adenylate cyclase